LSLLDRMLWNAALVSGPVLVAILLVGLAISVLQVATQIQEMTLTFVPKLLVTGLLMVFLGSWTMGKIAGFARELLLSIPNIAN
jgi:flagellar biosynthesis protein FliQ